MQVALAAAPANAAGWVELVLDPGFVHRISPAAGLHLVVAPAQSSSGPVYLNPSAAPGGPTLLVTPACA